MEAGRHKAHVRVKQESCWRQLQAAAAVIALLRCCCSANVAALALPVRSRCQLCDCRVPQLISSAQLSRPIRPRTVRRPNVASGNQCIALLSQSGHALADLLKLEAEDGRGSVLPSEIQAPAARCGGIVAVSGFASTCSRYGVHHKIQR